MIISFNGYNNILKQYWRRGKLPTVIKGFYGDTLTQQNLSLEHLVPHSKGGKTDLDNLVLASTNKNTIRGSNNILDFISVDKVKEYLKQFIGVRLKDFNGDSYIRRIKNTLKRLGVSLD